MSLRSFIGKPTSHASALSNDEVEDPQHGCWPTRSSKPCPFGRLVHHYPVLYSTVPEKGPCLPVLMGDDPWVTGARPAEFGPEEKGEPPCGRLFGFHVSRMVRYVPFFSFTFSLFDKSVLPILPLVVHK